jgi:hypothetical protein
MRNFWWWVIGAGGLLWVVNKSKAEPAHYAKGLLPSGDLAVSITWKPGQMASGYIDLGRMLANCGGPPLISNTEVGNSSVSGTTVTRIFRAAWTHNNMGPIKESVRVCLLKALQALDANITDVQSTRVS